MTPSYSHNIERRRKERVHIHYELDGDGLRLPEVPYIVGVLANLSGDNASALPPLADREFMEIEQQNFDKVMKATAPGLTYMVPNKLTNDGTKLGVNLRFQSFQDLSPDKVAEQIEPCKQLLEERALLKELLNKLPANRALREELTTILQNAEKRLALAKALGVPVSDTSK
jgi:type VI secretion system protein ImpB